MKKEPKILYHYTSMATLNKILQGVEENNYLTLRGTLIEYLNDKQEYNLAVELLIESLKEYDKKNGNGNKSEYLVPDKLKGFANLFTTTPFVSSFSTKDDSLPMWSTYAEKGKGVAIGIKYLKVKDWGDDFFDNRLVWGKCTYDINVYRDNLISEVTPEIYNNIEIKDHNLVLTSLGLHRLSEYFGVLKNKSFEYENEYRLLKRCDDFDKKKEIHFIEKDGILKPYINNILPIGILKEIVIGPCSDFELSMKSLKMCLLRSGYSNYKNDDLFVEIKQSKVPYRLI